MLNYLLFSDFDETIADDARFHVDASLTDLLTTHRQAISTVIVTSRGWVGVKPYIGALRLTLPQIIEGGAKIIDPVTEEILYRESLPSSAIAALQTIAVQHPFIATTFSAGEHSYTNPDLLDQVEDIGRVSFSMPPGEFASVLALLQTIPGIRFAHGPAMHTPGGNPLIDITSPNINKGKGIEKWLELFNPRPAAVLVAGNSENDIPMFDIDPEGLSLLRVAVDNAAVALKMKADIVVPAAYNNGLYFLLRSLLSSRYDLVKPSERARLQIATKALAGHPIKHQLGKTRYHVARLINKTLNLHDK